MSVPYAKNMSVEYAEKTTAGTPIEPALEGLGGDITLINSALEVVGGKVTSLETTVGNSDSGLVKDVAGLQQKTTAVTYSSGVTDVDGKLTADEIIENMSGYAFSKTEGTPWTPYYVGVCKNGNKLTLAIFGILTYTTGDTEFVLGGFSIPASVGEKLIPYTIGGNVVALDIKPLNLYDSTIYNSPAFPVNGEIDKSDSTTIIFVVRQLQNGGLTDGYQYLFRHEVTFLLGDNLITQP